MSDNESVDYLQPGFDPTSLTNPRLRSILVTYNVHYASNAKKPELVALFNAHVAPQASKILSRRARAKRSSMGIVDADTQSTATFDEEPEPEPEPRRRTGRRVKQEHEEEGGHLEAPTPRVRRTSPRKRQTRSSSFQPPAASDTDTGPDAEAALSRPTPARRSRTKTPQVKLEPTEEEEDVLPPSRPPQRQHHQHQHHHRHSSTDEDTVFTDDNPFQSGSSPLTAATSTTGKTSRRKTTGTESAAQKRTSRGASAVADTPASRRRTDGAVAAMSTSASSFACNTPLTRTHWSPPAKEPSLSLSPSPMPAFDDDDAVATALEPGEEFTPEAQLELAQEEAAERQRGAAAAAAAARRQANKTAALVPRRRRGFLSLTTPLWVLGITLLGAYGAWYRQEKIAVGYCGLGRPAVPLLAEQFDKLADQLDKLQLPGWVRDVEVPIPASLNVLVEPQCEPCPPHAFCYSDFSVSCENGYIAKPHPLALGGLVPLPPTCEPDGERARRVKAVADKAVEELRDRRAKWECGDLVDEEGQAAESPAIELPILKEVISGKRSKKMSKDEFDDLWKAAIGDIENREEIEVELEPEPEPTTYTAADSGAVPTRLSSTSLARLPLTCAIRRSIRLRFARYRFALSVLVAAVLAAFYVRARYRARRKALAQVPAIVDLVLARLAAQKELWLYDDGDERGALDGDNDDNDDAAPDPFLFLPQLRDDVLRSTHSLAARERVWKPVRAVVEQNSNVRTGQREGRNGEVGRAWEWIGPVGTATTVAAGSGGGGGGGGGLDMSVARRRRSGRMSSRVTPRASPQVVANSGGVDDRRPAEATGHAAAAGGGGVGGGGGAEENRSALHRRWQESRPIY